MRRADWAERLAEALKRSRTFSDRSYCATFSADCLLAMTGEDPMEGYRGFSLSEADRKIKEEGHKSLYHFLVSKLGQPVHPSKAKRGDVIYRSKPEIAVGICCGEQTAFISDSGLAYLPTLEQQWCFPVP